jgi:hypothetical protein
VASAATAAAARGDYTEQNQRAVALRGISAPLDVVTIGWQ